MPRTDINTVSGTVPVEALGRTLVHEHLSTVSEVVRTEWPHVVDHDGERGRAIAALESVKAHGVQTWCDPACLNLGRNARLAQDAAAATGVNVVLATGAYVYESLPRYFRFRDEDALADHFVYDAEHGIQGTDVRPAFIKCAVDEHGITPDVEKVLNAVGKAHVRTGLPVMSHCALSAVRLGPEGPIQPSPERRQEALDTTLRQIDLLVEGGVPAQAIQIAHIGDCDDLDAIERVLERGTFIGMDRYGLDFFCPSARRNEVVAALCERGHTERMMLSHDSCATLDWYPPGLVDALAPRWKPTLLFEEELPALAGLGVSDEQVDTMLVANPARWLAA
jgi:phosphotriesterase-related protein